MKAKYFEKQFLRFVMIDLSLFLSPEYACTSSNLFAEIPQFWGADGPNMNKRDYFSPGEFLQCQTCFCPNKSFINFLVLWKASLWPNPSNVKMSAILFFWMTDAPHPRSCIFRPCDCVFMFHTALMASMI